jgi:hypothetical protein
MTLLTVVKNPEYDTFGVDLEAHLKLTTVLYSFHNFISCLSTVELNETKRHLAAAKNSASIQSIKRVVFALLTT